MNVIEIVPPKQLTICIPKDMHRTLTLTNLTLYSVFVLLLNSHPEELSLSQNYFILQAFEERKVHLTLNWCQESMNLSTGKLRVYYQEVEEERSIEQLVEEICLSEGKSQWDELEVIVDLDLKSLEFLNYKVDKQPGEQNYQATASAAQKNYYLMRRISNNCPQGATQRDRGSSQDLQNKILNFLQKLPGVLSIEPQSGSSFLIQFQQEKPDDCQIVSFSSCGYDFVYAISKLVSYGYPLEMEALLTLNGNTAGLKQKAREAVSTQIVKQISTDQQQTSEKAQRQKEACSFDRKVEASQLQRKEAHSKKTFIKQSFLGRRQTDKVKSRRRNRSEERIIEHSSDQQQEAEMFREQLRELKPFEVEPIKESRAAAGQAKVKETALRVTKESSIEFTQKVLNLYIEERQGCTQVFVVLRDCIRWFVVGDPQARKTIKFDPIYEENVQMPCPVEKYKDDLIFGNETILYWINLTTDETQWKYVQRKYIYALAVIDELSLVAVGGKNFSKLSYFGKETSRSNIKLYSCSAGDKHQHLFTYDVPGNNVGNIMGLAYISVPPQGAKLLLAHSLNQASVSTFHFLRVKAFNKVEVLAQIDLDELGIINLLKFKHNRESGRVVCMEALGDTGMDIFKRLKIKCQYDKVEVFTEGIKLPLKRYISFQMGGSKEGREWMTLVDEQGTLAYLYLFESNHLEILQLGKCEIRQVFSVAGGRATLICTEGTLFVQETV